MSEQEFKKLRAEIERQYENAITHHNRVTQEIHDKNRLLKLEQNKTAYEIAVLGGLITFIESEL